MEDKICVNCKKKIDEKRDRYFEIKEYLEGKVIETKYVHKNCQDDYNKQLNSNMQLQAGTMKFLKNANQFLKNMGGEEVIKI